MKPRQGLLTTAQNYLSISTTSKSQFKCENCHLIFQSPIQLFNHTKKFCTDSGFDTLAGLNIRLKNPNYGMEKKQSKRKLNDSLNYALEQIQKNKAFKPMEKQLKNDLLNLQRHQQDVKYARPYMYQSKNNNEIYDSKARKSRSMYVNGNEENNQKNNYGQKAYNIQQNPHDSSRSKAYSFTSSYLRKFKESNAYVSPPTQIPLQQNAKQFSLLDKSDMSIKMMPQQQKREYVIRKILQLQQIQQGYKKNGGKNDQFIENTARMKKFYQQLLDKINKQKDSMFGGGKVSNITRVSTPISKLDRLQESRNIIESLVRPQDGKSSMIKSKISQIQQKNIAKRQDQVRKRFHTQVEGKSHKNINMNDILDDQMLRKITSNIKNEKQNQIIVIPIQQQPPISQSYPQQHQQSYQTQLTMKYIQSLSALKDEQNKNFLQILQKQNQEMKKLYQAQMKNKQKQSGQNEKKIKELQNKYQKLIEKMDRQRQKQQRNKLFDRQNNNLPINSDIMQQNNFRISQFKNNKNNRRNKTEYSQNNLDNDQKQYRQLHPQLDNVRLLNLESPGYHSQQYQQLSPQQRLLFQMQKQQRDELQLFAHLPVEIQKIKINSIQQLGQKRFQMEKQVIKQKLQKLKLSEQMKAFQLERRLLSQEMENQKKKIAIHKLMKKKIKQMVREQFEEQQQNDIEYEDKDDYVEGLQSRNTRGNKRLIQRNNLPSRESYNQMPV